MDKTGAQVAWDVNKKPKAGSSLEFLVLYKVNVNYF